MRSVVSETVKARIGFVNGMPTLIVCDPEYQKAAIENKVPLIGDDVKILPVKEVPVVLFEVADVCISCPPYE